VQAFFCFRLFNRNWDPPAPTFAQFTPSSKILSIDSSNARAIWKAEDPHQAHNWPHASPRDVRRADVFQKAVAEGQQR